MIITGSKHTPPKSRAEVDYYLEELLNWYEHNRQILHPTLLACITMYQFVWIHPFNDGNGRICRIIMNYILHKYGYPMFNISPHNRQGYYSALEKSDVNEDKLHIIHWFYTRYIKENRRYLNREL